MKYIIALILLMSVHNLSAQSHVKWFVTDNPMLADVRIGLTDNVMASDINVWVGLSIDNDINIAFVSYPSASTIDVELVNNASSADVTLYITNNTTIANKSLCITTNPFSADIKIGFSDLPGIYTKNIHVKNVDPTKLSIRDKVIIAYALGLLKKNNQ